MNILEFTKRFKDEESCRAYFKSYREQKGIVCPKCGCVHHYWKKNRSEWECKNCGHRTTLTSGTIMHGTKLPMLYWFIAIHLLTATKKTFSAAELQRQLGHKRYQPIWELTHKLRNAMGRRDSEYKLLGSIELDEGFFSTQYNDEEPLKMGRGSQAKTKVLVMTESEPAEDSKKTIKKSVGHIKMIVIYNISREYDRIHSVELDGETGRYYPDRARMNPLEDSLGDVEIWVYNETNEEVDDYVVEPHFHVCKSWIEEKGKTFYEIDIEVKIKNIEQLNIWRSVTGNTSWSGLEELYNDIKLWLNKKAFDADITNKEAIRLEWNRNNMSNRIDKDEL